jgi:hypothetical protein
VKAQAIEELVLWCGGRAGAIVCAIEASPGLAFVEVAGFGAGGLDMERKGLGGCDVWCVALIPDPLFGATKVKGKAELVVVPGARGAA